MGQQHSVSLYTLELKAGKTRLTQHVQGVTLISKRTVPLPIFQIQIRLNRLQYENDLLPFKDRLKLTVKSYKGISDDEGTNVLNPIMDLVLTIMYEVCDQSLIYDVEDSPASVEYTLICFPTKLFKKQQRLIKNKVFLDKNRQEILDDILDGTKYEAKSPIFEGKIIEQVVIPPVREVGAIEYLHHYWKLFKGSMPLFMTYSIIDDTLYIGSCNGNKYKWLEIAVTGESTISGEGDIPTAAHVANKDRVKGSRKAGTYSVTKPIKEIIHYNNMVASIGIKENFCFNPIDNLYSRVILELKDLPKSATLNNHMGEDEKLLGHLKKTNVKETWHHTHNGLLEVDEDLENVVFAEHYACDHLNQSVELVLDVDGAIVFDDFLYPGRRIQLKCDKNTLTFEGMYYLEQAKLSFKSVGMYWACSNQISVKTGLNPEKL